MKMARNVAKKNLPVTRRCTTKNIYLQIYDDSNLVVELYNLEKRNYP